MGNSFSFEDLNVYQNSLNLANEIINRTNKWPNRYQYSLADQLRRASLSIPLNIAEGSSKTTKEFRRFISIARGSCFECIPIINIAKQNKLISGNTHEIWYNQLVILAKMLSKLKTSLSSTK